MLRTGSLRTTGKVRTRMQTIGSNCTRLIVVGLAALLLAGGSLQAADGPPNARYGRKIEHVTFKNAAGKSVPLEELSRGKQAVVVVFLSFDCPVSSSYSQTLADMARAYADRVVFIPFRLVDFTKDDLLLRFRRALIGAALNSAIADALTNYNTLELAPDTGTHFPILGGAIKDVLANPGLFKAAGGVRTGIMTGPPIRSAA